MLTDRQQQHLEDMIRNRAAELGLKQIDIIKRTQDLRGREVRERTVRRLFNWPRQPNEWTPSDVTLGQVAKALEWPANMLIETVRSMKEVANVQ